jgi:hypothetical protein
MEHEIERERERNLERDDVMLLKKKQWDHSGRVIVLMK